MSWLQGNGPAYGFASLTGVRRYNRIQDNARSLMEGTDALKRGNQVFLWSRVAELRTVALRPVLAVLGCDLLVRMVLVIHMVLVVLGMLADSSPCCLQIGTGNHLESNSPAKRQSPNTLLPTGNLDQGGYHTAVAMDCRIAADIRVATRKEVVTYVQVVMTDNDLAGDIQVVYYQDHIVAESVFADTVGRRGDSMLSTMGL